MNNDTPFPFLVNNGYLEIMTDKDYTPQQKQKNFIDEVQSITTRKSINNSLSESIVKRVGDFFHIIFTYDELERDRIRKIVATIVGYNLKDFTVQYDRFIDENRGDNHRRIMQLRDEVVVAIPNDEYLQKFNTERLVETPSLTGVLVFEDRFSYEITIRNRGMIATGGTISSPRELAKLISENGFIVGQEEAKHLVKYFSLLVRQADKTIYRNAVTCTGWNKDFTQFNIPSRKIEDQFVESAVIEAKYTQRGDLAIAKKVIGEMANYKAFLVYYMALGSPLVKLLDLRHNYYLQITGTSGYGKTMVTKMVASLFGNPKKYTGNWKYTDTSVEMLMHENKCLPVFIDEVEKSSTPEKVLVTGYYDFSEGDGKGRSKPTIFGIKSTVTTSFSGVLISTSEKSIDTLQSEAKDSKKNGVERRGVDYNVGKDFLGEKFNAQKMDDLENLAHENHGLYVDEWLDFILKNKDGIKNKFQEIKAEYGFRLGGKENLFYLQMIVLDMLKNKGDITDVQAEFHVSQILKEVRKAEMARGMIHDPSIMFTEMLGDLIIAKPYAFGEGVASMGKEQLGKSGDDGEVYLTKTQFKQLLTQFKMLGVRDGIEDTLKSQGRLKTTQKTFDGKKSRWIVIQLLPQHQVIETDTEIKVALFGIVQTAKKTKHGFKIDTDYIISRDEAIKKLKEAVDERSKGVHARVE